MSVDKPRFERLTRDAWFLGQSSYLGEDYLLIVHDGMRETYRKIYYADIEALLYQPNAQSKIFAAISGICGLVSLLFAVSSTSESGLSGSSLFPWTVFVVAVFCFFYMIRGGGSVVFGVQSAVQTVRITGLNNKKKALHAIDRITERVVAVQGELTVSALSAVGDAQADLASRQKSQGMVETSETVPAAGIAAGPPPLRSDKKSSETHNLGEALSNDLPTPSGDSDK